MLLQPYSNASAKIAAIITKMEKFYRFYFEQYYIVKKVQSFCHFLCDCSYVPTIKYGRPKNNLTKLFKEPKGPAYHHITIQKLNIKNNLSCL